MNKKFPNLEKGIDFQEVQEVQEAQRVPKKVGPKRNTPRNIIIKLPKINDKEIMLKAASERRELPTNCAHNAIS